MISATCIRPEGFFPLKWIKWKDGLYMPPHPKGNWVMKNCSAHIQFIILGPTVCKLLFWVLWGNIRLKDRQVAFMGLVDRQRAKTQQSLSHQEESGKCHRYAEEDGTLWEEERCFQLRRRFCEESDLWTGPQTISRYELIREGWVVSSDLPGRERDKRMGAHPPWLDASHLLGAVLRALCHLILIMIPQVDFIEDEKTKAQRSSLLRWRN